MPKAPTVTCRLPIRSGTPYPIYVEEYQVTMRVGNKVEKMPVALKEKFMKAKPDDKQLKAELEEWKAARTKRRAEANKKAREWERHNGLWVNDMFIQHATPFIKPPEMPAELMVLPTTKPGRQRWIENFLKRAREADKKRTEELEAMAAYGHCLLRPLNGTVTIV